MYIQPHSEEADHYSKAVRYMQPKELGLGGWIPLTSQVTLVGSKVQLSIALPFAP